MKYLIQLFTILFLASFLTVTAEAQIFKHFKEKAQEAVQNKAEQKMDDQIQKSADQMVEKSWNAVFGGISKNFVLNSNVTTEDVYDFDTITTMEFTSVDGDGKTEPPVYMDMHSKKGAQYTGTKFRGDQMDEKNGELFIIYDFKNSAMIMLMQNDKDKFSFAYDWKQALKNAQQMQDSLGSQQQEANRDDQKVNQDETVKWPGYTKIGNKTIAGYNCTGYHFQDDQNQGTFDIWVTPDFEGMQNIFNANANAKQIKGIFPANYPYGMPMEMTTKDLKTGDQTTMRVTDVNKSENVRYAIADYPKMSLGKKSAEK